MTNKEWLSSKFEPLFEKYFYVITIFIDLILIGAWVCCFVFDALFCILGVAMTFPGCLFTSVAIKDWLDKEHKEKVINNEKENE